jgi:CMP-N,N'-diacetyllegionaminic acid synthase
MSTVSLNDFLFIIPARSGSKGIPGKNIKMLGGKRLIYYAIDLARKFVPDDQICVSTDSDEIKNIVEIYGLKVPFLRPVDLSSDKSGTREVLLHALEFYEKTVRNFKTIVLLQPTSPFRNFNHLEEALKLYNHEFDLVVSVVETDSNPYYNLFEENESGFLKQSKVSQYERRQDCPKIYQFNGAIYIINSNSIKIAPMNKFKKIIKFEMDKVSSVDLDTPLDWNWAEFLLSKSNLVKNN